MFKLAGWGKFVHLVSLMDSGTAAAQTAPWSWDTTNKSANIVLSNGNLTATSNMSSPPYYQNIVGTYSIDTPDKVMFSLTFSVNPTDGTAGYDAFGLATAAFGLTDGLIGYGATSVGAYSNDGVYFNSAPVTSVGSFDTSGTVIDVCFDAATMSFWYRFDGGNWNENALADPATGVGGATLSGPTLPVRPAIEIYTDNPADPVRSWTINTTAAYAVPSGFKFLYGQPVLGSYITLTSGSYVLLTDGSSKIQRAE